MEKTIDQLADDLNAKLEQLIERLQNTGEPVPEQTHQLLGPRVCRLAKMLIPNVHKKMDEVIYAGENQEKHVVVIDHPTGPDMKNEKGGHIELKVSVLSDRKTCNFNFPLPKASHSHRRAALIKSIQAKVSGKGGGAALRIESKLGRPIADFFLSGDFLVEYFTKLRLGKSSVHNMGCKQCSKCEDFHRLQILQEASDMYDDDIESVDWDEVFKSGKASQCTVKKEDSDSYSDNDSDSESDSE